MARPQISEFSFGYALTEELCGLCGGVTAAPVFPSLINEGRVGGGYDVKLRRVSGLLFLQFKLSDGMTHRAREARNNQIDPPFHRFHLWQRSRSQQHALLLELESINPDSVFYAAPLFHQERELNAAYASKKVVERSAFVAPSTIGSLVDDKYHHVSVGQQSGRDVVYFCSETPRLIRKKVFLGHTFSDLILAKRTEPNWATERGRTVARLLWDLALRKGVIHGDRRSIDSLDSLVPKNPWPVVIGNILARFFHVQTIPVLHSEAPRSPNEH